MRRVFDAAMLFGAMFAVSTVAAAQTTSVQPSTTPPAQQTPPPARPSQTPPPSGQTPAPTTVEPARTTRQPTAPGLPSIPANVKLDLSITDTYTGTPVKKTVSMLILNGQNGMIRTSNRLATGFNVGLNVDAAVMIQQGGLITVRVTFEYTPAQTTTGIVQTDDVAKAQAEQKFAPRPQPAELHESLSVILQDGKPLLVSQSADPTTDRKVMVELMATVLK
jgi:hypothetical protein